MKECRFCLEEYEEGDASYPYCVGCLSALTCGNLPLVCVQCYPEGHPVASWIQEHELAAFLSVMTPNEKEKDIQVVLCDKCPLCDPTIQAREPVFQTGTSPGGIR